MSRAKIRILEPGDEAALEAFLLPHLASSMFLIGNLRAAGFLDDGERYEGSYAAAFQRGKIVAVVAHYWNGNLVLQAQTCLADLCRVATTASKRPIQGLIGPDRQVDAVRRLLDIKKQLVQLDETEKLYCLTLDELILPEGLRSGRLRGRRMEPRDMSLQIEWQVAYGAEALGEVPGADARRRARAGLEQMMREARTWILEDQGEPVATSSFNTAIHEAVQVGGVWTPPYLRNRGYGRAAVAASLLDARAEGVAMAILFTGEDNVPAQRAYEALGFRHIGDYRIVLLKESPNWGG
jgi:predicted GNAT family acetyltransferase